MMQACATEAEGYTDGPARLSLIAKLMCSLWMIHRWIFFFFSAINVQPEPSEMTGQKRIRVDQFTRI